MKLRELLDQLGVSVSLTYSDCNKADLDADVCIEVLPDLRWPRAGDLLEIERVEKNATTAVPIHILAR